MPDPVPAPAPNLPAPAPAPAPSPAPAPAPAPSVLSDSVEKPEEWLQDKYIVKDAAGKIDVMASAKATAKAHRDLTARMVETGLPPKDADSYELEVPKGVDLAELQKDPEFKSALKGYHALGMTNKQVSQVINDFLRIAPQIAGGAQQLTNEEVIADLGKIWKTPVELRAQTQGAARATETLARSLGIDYADIDASLGNNPIFIRLMAGLSKQMGEDGGFPAAGGMAPAEFESQVKALDAELAAIPERDKKGREAVLAKKSALYAKRYPETRAPALTA